MGNLIVKDDEHQELGKLIKEAGDIAEDQFDRFIRIMEKITSAAIEEGTLHANLKMFVGQARSMKYLVERITNPVSADMPSLVDDIDVADEYLY